MFLPYLTLKYSRVMYVSLIDSGVAVQYSAPVTWEPRIALK